MGFVLAAVAAVAAAFSQLGTQTSSASPRQHTLYSHAGSIAAFAQDGPEVAWFAPGKTACNTVHLLSLSNGIGIDLPTQSAQNVNVTCRFVRTPLRPVHLALAYDAGRAIWTLPQLSPLPLDYLLGAGIAPGAGAERRFVEIAHTPRGVGQWLGGVAGDGDSLVYAFTTVGYADEAGCLAGTSPCTLIRSGGGVYRLQGREQRHVPGTGPAVAVAVSRSAVAYVPAAAVGKNGEPVAGDGVAIRVVDIRNGHPILTVAPRGTALAIALAPHVLASLERTPLGLRLAWYDRTTGAARGSIPVPRTTTPALTATDRLIVFRVGRSLRGVDVGTTHARVLTRAAATPIGLSLEGTRLAWGENLPHSFRIQAFYVSGSG